MDNFAKTVKELEWYLRSTNGNRFKLDIMTKTLATFPDPCMPTIIPDTFVEHPKIDMDMTYFKKKTIDEAIFQKLRKKDFYKTYRQKI